MSANIQNSEILRAISDARNVAMVCTAHARIPESGDFGQIAQALDYAMPKVAKLIDALAACDAEIAELRKDAERWKFTKGCIDYRNESEWLEYVVGDSSTREEFESRIDQAIAIDRETREKQ